MNCSPSPEHRPASRSKQSGLSALAVHVEAFPERRFLLDSAPEARLTPLRRVAFIGNSLPRRCGIATFTHDLQQAIAATRGAPETAIVAMTDKGGPYDYPQAVRFDLNEAQAEEYSRAADFLNAGRYDVVCLQHEFGIFGGDAGSHVLQLLTRLTMPIVTTLHTVLAEPSPIQLRVLRAIAEVSTTVVVMAQMGRKLLHEKYGVPTDKIQVIPHGIPDCAFVESSVGKTLRGFDGKSVILTFGLLSPNKGIEFVIDAMPSILEKRSDAVYIVLGATHPNLVRNEGEAYRERLKARAQALGVQDHVVFLDQFVDRETLIEFISMCDVYVTPYLNEAQMTSGTLAYSFGLGKAVVSTPYWHARELLADGRGVLVPFSDSGAIGLAIAGLLTDEARRAGMSQLAYTSSRSMTWKRTAERYIATFEHARDTATQPDGPACWNESAATLDAANVPNIKLDYLAAMCDDTGLFQHAIHSVPDRSHGYCVDDNARALLVACALGSGAEERLPEPLIARFAAFVQHAWNCDTRRFRNFMSFDRRWLEETGSEDSHGRTLWALGECARSDTNPSRRLWAAALFAQAAASTENFASPRAWAFTLLGLNSYLLVAPDDTRAAELQRLLAERLLSLFAAVETADWVWFEASLAYDNARLSQALIVTGESTGNAAYIAAGLRSLRWLMTLQTAASGVFRPVGTQSFGHERIQPLAFDQQPLEATAAISACIAAARVDSDPRWTAEAVQAFAWFLGDNDLSSPLADTASGSCRDGLHPGRVNENRGGESVVSYLLSLSEIRQLHRAAADPARASSVVALRA